MHLLSTTIPTMPGPLSPQVPVLQDFKPVTTAGTASRASFISFDLSLDAFIFALMLFISLVLYFGCASILVTHATQAS